MVKPHVAIVLGSGGHTRQMLRLVDNLGKKYKYTYLIADTDKTSEKHIKIRGKVYKIKDTRLKTDTSLIKIILKYIPSTINVISTLNKIRPNFIIACGPAMCLHTLVLAKYLFGARLIFFESWVRVKSKSISGRQIYPFFTDNDLFMVQWKTLLKSYPCAKFVGRLG
jgi:beta-1,4-N-acetylglucosaminyltransferase